MSPDPSVTEWISQAKAGDQAAFQKLWERYFQRLVGLARKKLHGQPRRMADEEDVALSAFDSFCRGAEEGRLPQVLDRDNLWRLLVLITVRKVVDLVNYHGRQKRAGLLGESALDERPGWPEDGPVMEQVLGPKPTPEFAAQVAEEYQRLLARLDDDLLRAVAQWKMEGYTTEEIADRLGCAPRTVERKLRVIRTVWSSEVAS
jgi:DNA-directed RNA polymerase specialized sigma24 family protein